MLYMINNCINTVKNFMSGVMGIIIIRLSWVFIHWSASRIYPYFCASEGVIGLLLSPFVSQAPHCVAIFWLIEISRRCIKDMWIIIGTYVAYRISIIMSFQNGTPATEIGNEVNSISSSSFSSQNKVSMPLGLNYNNLATREISTQNDQVNPSSVSVNNKYHRRQKNIIPSHNQSKCVSDDDISLNNSDCNNDYQKNMFAKFWQTRIEQKHSDDNNSNNNTTSADDIDDDSIDNSSIKNNDILYHKINVSPKPTTISSSKKSKKSSVTSSRKTRWNQTRHS